MGATGTDASDGGNVNSLSDYVDSYVRTDAGDRGDVKLFGREGGRIARLGKHLDREAERIL